MNIILAEVVTQTTDWWLNPWLVAIVPAIISGIVVNYISRALWSRKDNSELRQKIDAANNEIIYALRPSVAEGSMPSKEILDSLINATSQKYGLKPENLMTLNEYADRLIKEVMDSNFISHEQKIKYASEVSRIKKQTKIRNLVAPASTIRLGTTDPLYVYRKRIQERAIIMLTLTTGVVTLTASLFSFLYSNKPDVHFPLVLDDQISSILIAASIMPILLVLYGFYTRLISKKEKEDNTEDVLSNTISVRFKPRSSKKE